MSMSCAVSTSPRASSPRSETLGRPPAAQALAESLPAIWRELKLPGSPGLQLPVPSRRDAEITYQRLDTALSAYAWRRASKSPSLDLWLGQAGAAQACLQGVAFDSCTGDGPRFITHPNPGFALNRYIAELMAQRVDTVVALAPAPWWPQRQTAFGPVQVTPLAGKQHTLGRAECSIEVTETLYDLARGAQHHSLHVLQVPWKDFGTLPAAALAQCAAMANARSGRGVMAVHCGAGIGRTGTFVVAAQLLLEQEAPPADLGLNGQAALAFVWTRMHRPGAVETSEQFVSTLGAVLALNHTPKAPG